MQQLRLVKMIPAVCRLVNFLGFRSSFK